MLAYFHHRLYFLSQWGYFSFASFKEHILFSTNIFKDLLDKDIRYEILSRLGFSKARFLHNQRLDCVLRSSRRKFLWNAWLLQRRAPLWLASMRWWRFRNRMFICKFYFFWSFSGIFFDIFHKFFKIWGALICRRRSVRVDRATRINFQLFFIQLNFGVLLNLFSWVFLF